MKETIFEMYKSISIGQNTICEECNKEKELGLPLSLYFVGEKFQPSEDTIMFVGKNAIGGEGIGQIVDNIFIDSTNFGALSLGLEEEWSTRRAFYAYTNEIIKRYYGSYEFGKQFVALTNIIKCNNSSTNDQTSFNTKKFCIEELQVIWREVNVLQPKRIIFYTGRDYDEFIDEFRPSNYFNHIDIEDDETNCWWNRKFINEDSSTALEILRVFHPQRKIKEEYISKILDWLNQTK